MPLFNLIGLKMVADECKGSLLLVKRFRFLSLKSIKIIVSAVGVFLTARLENYLTLSRFLYYCSINITPQDPLKEEGYTMILL